MMEASSRTWIPALLAIMVVVAAPVYAQDNQPTVEVSHITGPLHLLRVNDNVAVVASVGEDGTLLVDTAFTETAPAVKEALLGLAPEPKPIRVVVNTHGDGDHVGGNAALGATALILSHPGTRRQMSAYFALPTLEVDGLPQITLSSESTIYFNGDAIRLLPVPGGHAAGDMVVHFARSGVACLGDIVLNGTFANADPGRGGDARYLLRVLRELRMSLPADTILVPGHGAILNLTELDSYIEMVASTITAVETEVAAGRSLAEILPRQPLAAWSEWESAEVGLSIDRWTTEIYASLKKDEYPQSICAPMTEALIADGVDAAVQLYRRLKTEASADWSFAENELNLLGYQLLQRQMVDEAIVIFKLNVEAYPEAFNPPDSLGEAYMAAGQDELAIASYQRSLALNPDNTNAVAMLERLYARQ
jgi:glyoxylase-like metal-dependent hydrolase (beta-lactamase superfamily II)